MAIFPEEAKAIFPEPAIVPEPEKLRLKGIPCTSAVKTIEAEEVVAVTLLNLLPEEVFIFEESPFAIAEAS